MSQTHSCAVRCVLCLVSLTLCAAASAAPKVQPDQAPGESPTLIGIRSAYDLMHDAFEDRNLTLAMSCFAPDYAAADEKGARISREQEQQIFRERMAQVRSAQSHYTIESLTRTTAGTWAEMRMHTEGIGIKRVLFARVRARFQNDLRVRDLWVSTPQGWHLKYRQTLQDETHLSPG